MHKSRIIGGGLLAAAACVISTILFEDVLSGCGYCFTGLNGLAFFFIAPVFVVVFAVSIIAGEYFSIRGLLYYSLFGVAACIVAFMALHNFTIEKVNGIILETRAVLAGFFGGIAYWLITGRHAGRG